MDLVNIQKNSSDWGLKYRPTTLSDLILPERFKTLFQSVIDKKQMVNFLFSGNAGCGKTSLAYILSDALDFNTLYLNMSKDTSIDVLRNDITNFGSTVAFNGNRKMIICDECEKASINLKEALKAEIENLSENVSFIFITNHVNMMTDALLSRLQHIEFTFTNDESKQMKTQIYKRVIEILKLNNCQYEEKAVQIIVNKLFPDFRRILNRCQCLANQNSLTLETVNSSITVNTEEYFNILKNGKFEELRKYVASLNINAQVFYSEIFKDIDKFYEKNMLAQAIVLLAKYSYESAFVIDYELNIMAMSIELKMLEKGARPNG